MSTKKSSSKKKKSKQHKVVPYKILPIFLGCFITILVLIGILALFEIIFINKILPGIKIAGIAVGGLTKEQAEQKVSNEITKRLNKKITLNDPQSDTPQAFEIPLSQTIGQLDIRTAADQAFSSGHQSLIYKPINISVQGNPTFLNESIAILAKNVDQPAIDSELKMISDQINVSPSQDGEVVDREKIREVIINYINSGDLSVTTLPIKKVSPKLSYEKALSLKKRLDQIKLNNLKIVYQDKAYPSGDDKTFSLDLATALSLIKSSETQATLAASNLPGSSFTLQSMSFGDTTLTDETFSLDRQKTEQYLQTLASQINRDVQEPLFNFDPTTPNRVKEFSPPTQGKKVNFDLSFDRLNQAFTKPEQQEVSLVVDTINPKNQLTNDMGIKELIGTGVSYFNGSIENRIFNVGHGAAKINGVLVGPGQEFSFDQTVGDITAATGFKQAYVIKSGRTVLDDGGGICQVSTTLFRAALNAGLPITARTAHAYRVHYYEEGGFGAGLDATIFYPNVDFKFKNDSPNYILIQTIKEGLQLTVNLYGTSDGRVASITKPVFLSQTPAPPELRQDDPTLPKGTVKQVDFAAPGAVTEFKRTVVRNGETIINETYKSNYRPWQAIYLVGTKEG